MIEIEPKYITFDCYGTLTAFGMSAVTRELIADRVPAEHREDFLDDFEAYRGDEVLGAYKPYAQVINDALARTATATGRRSTSPCRPGARTRTCPSHWPHWRSATRW